MKNKALFTLLLLVMCSVFALNVWAASPDRLVDGADLLSEAEESEIRAKLDEVSEKYNVDVIIVTIRSVSTDADAFAKAYFNDNGYGMGDDDSGILFLRVLEDEEGDETCTIFANAVGADAVSDSDVEDIFDEIESDINANNYSAAFKTFIAECDERIQDATSFSYVKNAVVAIIIGLVVALIATSVMKGKLKSVRSQAAASNYMKSGSLNVTDSKDTYLYSTVTRTAKPKSNTSGGGSGRTSGGSRKM